MDIRDVFCAKKRGWGCATLAAGAAGVLLALALLSGLCSVSGVEYSVHVLAGDTEPPLVVEPSASPEVIAANGIQESQLNVSVTDPSGVLSVTVNLSALGGPEDQELQKIGNSSVYTSTATAAFGTPPGNYRLPIIATDNSSSSNSNRSVSFFITVIEPRISTYDFATNASVDRWAYRSETAANPPLTENEPRTRFSRPLYTRIAAEDSRMAEDSTQSRGYYATHRFEFHLAEDPAEITRIEVRWTGSGTNALGTQGVRLYSWNGSASAYEQLDIATSSSPTTLRGTITRNIDAYVNENGRLMLVAEQNSPHWQFWRWQFRSSIATDYLRVQITL